MTEGGSGSGSGDDDYRHNDHAASERRSLLSKISGVIGRRASSVTATAAAQRGRSPPGPDYGAASATDEESAQQHQQSRFRMPSYGYHMSMTNSSFTSSGRKDVVAAAVGSYDDCDSDDNSQCEPQEEDESHEIGYLGSFAIAINSLAGPAVLQLPFQYQQSGFVATTLALLGVAVVSVACSMYICRVVQAIPSTAKIERPVELSTVVDYFWSRKAYLVTQWLFFACTFCLNVAAMIDTAQVVDTFLGVSGGKMLRTVGWTPFPTSSGDDDDESSRYFHTWIHPKCTRKQVKLGHCDPFVYNTSHELSNGTTASVMEPLAGPILTLGYVTTAAVFGPLCVMDLKENTNWQIGGCFLLLTLSVYFCFAFLQMDLGDGSPTESSAAVASPTSAMLNHTLVKEEHYYDSALEFYRPDNVTTAIHGFAGSNHASTIFTSSSASPQHHNNLKLWGQEYRDLLGVIMFNFALVLALPAWLHTKKRSVKVSNVVYGSTGISTVLYIAVGTIVAITIPHANQNMLAPMVSGAFGAGIQAASSLFCFFIIGLDIPLFCVLTRYNLSKLLPGRPTLVNALVVYIPWGLSWVLYQGDAIGTLLDWGGVLLTSAIAFLLPLYLAYRVLLYTDLPLFPDLVLSSSPAARRGQIRTVLGWLVVTAVAVVAAIGGQAAVQADKYEYLHSDEYLNGTAAA